MKEVSILKGCRQVVGWRLQLRWICMVVSSGQRGPFLQGVASTAAWNKRCWSILQILAAVCTSA